jgi:hypothetical protein
VRAVKLDSPGTIIELHNSTGLLIYLRSFIDTLYLMYFYLHLQYVAVIIKKKRINFNILVIQLDVSYLTT